VVAILAKIWSGESQTRKPRARGGKVLEWRKPNQKARVARSIKFQYPGWNSGNLCVDWLKAEAEAIAFLNSPTGPLKRALESELKFEQQQLNSWKIYII